VHTTSFDALHVEPRNRHHHEDNIHDLRLRSLRLGSCFVLEAGLKCVPLPGNHKFKRGGSKGDFEPGAVAKNASNTERQHSKSLLVTSKIDGIP